MMTKKTRGYLLLLITAIIWGSAFVAQSSAADAVEPFTYISARSYLAFLFLIPVILIMDRMKNEGKDAGKKRNWKPSYDRRMTWVGGILCGVLLTVASFFQQWGIAFTTAGKSGFVTALYIIFVPILSVFIGKRIPKIVWFCVTLAIVGFYLLCIKESFSVSKGDFLTLLCAISFAGHIMVVDSFTSRNVHTVRMACVQFLVAAIISTICMLFFEKPNPDRILQASLPILYAGILSSGVGYTLQIVGQKDTDPAPATLIMSLESVFAVIAGGLFLHERMSFSEILGCVLVFIAVILAQIPVKCPFVHTKSESL